MENTQISLLAKSETNEVYEVIFTKSEDKVTVTCSCPEGSRGEFCEHKFRLASNDMMMLQLPGQNSAMLNAHMWVIDTPMSDKLLDMLNLIAEDEPDFDAIEKAKVEIAKAMRGE